MNNNEERQQSAAENNEMSYFDRVVLEAGGTADDIKEGKRYGNVSDDVSIWSETNDSDAVDESSDEEMEYDSDEDSIRFN